MFFPAPGISLPLISTVVSYDGRPSSDYSIRIWDGSHGLGWQKPDETSVITDQANVVEMLSRDLLLLLLLFLWLLGVMMTVHWSDLLNRDIFIYRRRLFL